MIVEPINIASMPKTRKCALCGREFVPNSGTQKYCSEECAEQAKEVKKKRQRRLSPYFVGFLYFKKS